jgi:pimeloyl-ACP methyl ester carboxylesterase
LGYGATAERRIGVPTTIAHEAEIVESVVRRAARPVHLVGHSFGGLVALSVALRNRLPLLSLAILEAPVPELLRHVQEHRHYRDFRAMTDGYFREFHAGNREAIGSMIDFYGGPGAFAAMPPRVRSYAVETTAVNILDWADAYSFRVTPALLGEIELPTLVLWGGASHPAVGRANELLARHIADASAVTVAGAAHFMIATHAQETARAVAQHIARARQQLRSTALRRAG